ncbi:shikimate kinase [Alkalinema sp. FACHB-956]|uniref:shikimate kinase n=1 Tax=Alkalinema sp. FACHB-956 TaxID=2692768 RepID=UPI001683795A|nr:shikimate kinase [Alkalinema sp. FACHB-956]MBD2327296.1 shikimate kinase [Alkalinema sp. FACHB-956]
MIVNPTTVHQALQGTNLYLIGMMGSGKSTVGQVLADRLGYQFFDSDTVIEQVAQQPVSQIFAESGEAVFRELETRVLAEIAGHGRKLVATGGGIVLKPENWGYLRHGVIIWLDASIEILKTRLEADTTRPLLQGTDLETKLTSLYADRQALYAQADLRIMLGETDTPEEICDRILLALAKACQEKRDQDATIEELNRQKPFRLEE